MWYRTILPCSAIASSMRLSKVCSIMGSNDPEIQSNKDLLMFCDRNFEKLLFTIPLTWV